MGAVWLASLPKVLADAGLNVTTWPGWEIRSRRSGGYDAVWGIGVHHDAALVGTSLLTRCRYAWEQSSTRPIGALWLHTDGSVVVGAAGATNTQGMGGPYKTSRGTIPLDAGNRYMLSIEASNNGVGEVWPEVQQDAYVKMCRALCDWLRLDPKTDVIAHFEWTSRKIDPRGPSRYAAGVNKWNMGAFRSDIASNPIPKPELPEGEDSVLVNLVKRKGSSAVYAQYSGGYKTWIPDANVLGIYQFVSGKQVKEMPDDNWMRATGPILGPIPPNTDEWGLPSGN